MVHPLIPYAMRGVIWYQGEYNTYNAYWYRTLLQQMITDWRARWGQGDFPFGIVQLANHGDVQTEPVEESAKAEVRESQLIASQQVKNAGLAVIIDTSEDGNLHPTNKQDVSHRLALWALATVYDRDVAYLGPVFDKMRVEGDKAHLDFKPSGGDLMTRGGTLTGFAVAGSDKVFHAAQAMIEGRSVVVWSPEVAVPVAVRYGWANNPVCNLYNRGGLPASPFRTDDWPGVTQPAP
jgi:sialate O-acetylesterase